MIPCTRASKVKQIGLDFARFGSDETAIYRRSGNAIAESFIRAKVDPNDAVDHAVNMMRRASWRPSDTWFIGDAGGMGQGVMGNFHKQGLNLVEFHNGGKPTDNQYANKITQAYFELGKALRARERYLPFDQTLVNQLAGRQYFLNAKNKLIL